MLRIEYFDKERFMRQLSASHGSVPPALRPVQRTLSFLSSYRSPILSRRPVRLRMPRA